MNKPIIEIEVTSPSPKIQPKPMFSKDQKKISTFNHTELSKIEKRILKSNEKEHKHNSAYLSFDNINDDEENNKKIQVTQIPKSPTPPHISIKTLLNQKGTLKKHKSLDKFSINPRYKFNFKTFRRNLSSNLHSKSEDFKEKVKLIHEKIQEKKMILNKAKSLNGKVKVPILNLKAISYNSTCKTDEIEEKFLTCENLIKSSRSGRSNEETHSDRKSKYKSLIIEKKTKIEKNNNIQDEKSLLVNIRENIIKKKNKKNTMIFINENPSPIDKKNRGFKSQDILDNIKEEVKEYKGKKFKSFDGTFVKVDELNKYDFKPRRSNLARNKPLNEKEEKLQTENEELKREIKKLRKYFMKFMKTKNEEIDFLNQKTQELENQNSFLMDENRKMKKLMNYYGSDNSIIRQSSRESSINLNNQKGFQEKEENSPFIQIFKERKSLEIDLYKRILINSFEEIEGERSNEGENFEEFEEKNDKGRKITIIKDTDTLPDSDKRKSNTAGKVLKFN